MPKIISTHSFRGGTGKSNTTANLAVLVARLGFRVEGLYNTTFEDRDAAEHLRWRVGLTYSPDLDSQGPAPQGGGWRVPRW